MDCKTSRRGFLSQTLTGISAAWISAQWPAMLSAATHARQAVKSASPPKFEFFSPEQAVGDRCHLGPHHSHDRYPRRPRSGRRIFHRPRTGHFCQRQSKIIFRRFARSTGQGARTISSRGQILRRHARAAGSNPGVFRPAILPRGKTAVPFAGAGAQSFFETVRVHTISGFLIDPDSDKRGNRDGAGWKVIGRENRAHVPAAIRLLRQRLSRLAANSC